MYQTILVPWEGSSLAAAPLRLAKRLAEASNGRIQLVTSVRHSDALAAARRLVGYGVVELAVFSSDITEATIEQAQSRKLDLVVTVSPGPEGLTDDSLASRVLAGTSTPVLLAPPCSEAAWSSVRAGHILVPLDGSDLAEEAIWPATALADAIGADLMLVRVAEVAGCTAMCAVPKSQLTLPIEAAGYLESASARLRAAGRVAALHVAGGNPATIITGLAHDSGALAIVLASRGHGGGDTRILGRVAGAILKTAHCPVMVTQPTLVSTSLASATTPGGVLNLCKLGSKRAATARQAGAAA